MTLATALPALAKPDTRDLILLVIDIKPSLTELKTDLNLAKRDLVSSVSSPASDIFFLTVSSDAPTSSVLDLTSVIPLSLVTCSVASLILDEVDLTLSLTFIFTFAFVPLSSLSAFATVVILNAFSIVILSSALPISLIFFGIEDDILIVPSFSSVSVRPVALFTASIEVLIDDSVALSFASWLFDVASLSLFIISESFLLTVSRLEIALSLSAII